MDAACFGNDRAQKSLRLSERELEVDLEFPNPPVWRAFLFLLRFLL